MATTGAISWHVDILHKGEDYYVRLEFNGQPDLFEERGPIKDKSFATEVSYELSNYVKEALLRRLSAIRHVSLAPSGCRSASRPEGAQEP